MRALNFGLALGIKGPCHVAAFFSVFCILFACFILGPFTSFFKLIYFITMVLCMCFTCMSGDSRARGTENTLDFVELELHTDSCEHQGSLGIDPVCSARATSALNY